MLGGLLYRARGIIMNYYLKQRVTIILAFAEDVHVFPCSLESMTGSDYTE